VPRFLDRLAGTPLGGETRPAARSARRYAPRSTRCRRTHRGVHFQPALRGPFSTGLDTPTGTRETAWSGRAVRLNRRMVDFAAIDARRYRTVDCSVSRSRRAPLPPRRSVGGASPSAPPSVPLWY
jgi:hypothetical protein